MVALSLPTQVIQSCLQRGIREFVVCGGARNAPLIAALENAPSASVWSHFEERGAGFFALGRTRATGEPCAVITTSGTAVAEVLPSIIEAHYQGKPLVVLSADRPKRFRGTGAPQAIEQAGLFSSYVEQSIDLDTVDEDVFAQWSGCKPFHLNVCLEEEVWPDEEYVLGFKEVSQNQSSGINVGELARFLREDFHLGLVVLLGGLQREDQEEVYHFLKDLNVPVLADATSGLREVLGRLVLADGDSLLASVKPRKVLRIGDVPVGRFWRDLEKLKKIDVCSITSTGFSGLSRQSKVIEGNISRILRGLGEVDEIGDVLDILKRNTKRQTQIGELLESYPDSEASFVRLFSYYASLGSSIYLGNSLPIREWNEFAQREQVCSEVMANRGANGIDGQIATWLGATAGEQDSWSLLGDLTAMYDFPSLSLLNAVEQKGRVLAVMNNGGGRIFDRLPRLQKSEKQTQLAIRSQAECCWESVAKTWKMDYQLIESSDDLEIEAKDSALLVELRPDEKQTKQFWTRWNQM